MMGVPGSIADGTTDTSSERCDAVADAAANVGGGGSGVVEAAAAAAAAGTGEDLGVQKVSCKWVEKGRRKLGHFADVDDWIIVWNRA